MSSEVYLRDVLRLPESVHAGDFKVDLSKGFTATESMVEDYVVTDQLQDAFRRALNLVRAALRDGSSHAAYLHGSFGAGKSHFLTVLHAILNNHPVARAKQGLQPVIDEHDEWLRGRKFLMVPYHLVGAADLDSALLGGYVRTVRELHPDAPTPAVYRSDEMLRDAENMRNTLGDDKFLELLGDGAGAADEDDLDDLDVLDDTGGRWTSAALDAAFAAPAGDTRRSALVSALLSGPLSAYASAKQGEAEAFLPLENGLAVISQHAKQLGYDGIVLFLDELILWLQAHLSRREFVNDQVSKLVKLIESGDTNRPVPIVSLISRQRDLTQLVGSDVKNLEQQVQYLAERFDTISLEDRNLPAIIKERVLKPRSDDARAQLDAAFGAIESTKADVKDALLDANGATHADWSDFRKVYPLSPALLNVLVALSGALQRERTGLKLLQDLLYRRRETMKLGELIPLGDLWDVLAEGSTAAFTDRLRKEAESAAKFHAKVRAFLDDKYPSPNDPNYIADDRLIKTLLLASLAPDVPALQRLTGRRLAALNHGSLRSRTVEPGSMAVKRLREIEAAMGGELRAEGDEDPVFTLHLSDLDIEPILDAVSEVDTLGQRKAWVREQLWDALGVTDDGAFVCTREVVWRGSKRTAEFVCGNVRERQTLPNEQFTPNHPGSIRFVFDYPFDDPNKYPSDDLARLRELQRADVHEPTIVWLPSFLSDQRSTQLGRLIKIRYLLERPDRLESYTSTLSSDDRIRVRHQLEAQRDTLTTQLTGVLGQLYGISRLDPANAGAEVGDEGHVFSLYPDHKPRLQGGAGFEFNMLALADDLFGHRYPKHPNFDVKGDRKPVTPSELRNALHWITRATEEGGRVELDRNQLTPVGRIVHPLELGEVHDGPLTTSPEWRKRIDQHAARVGATGDYAVEDIRKWIADLGYTGLDKLVSNLIIATYALLTDSAWVHHGIVENPPSLEQIGTGWSLRAQELPSEDEFQLARERAGRLFGVAVSAVRYTGNVTKLASAVREKVGTYEPAVHGLHRSLDKHSEQLGIDASAPRVRSTRAAADLLASLSAAESPTQLARKLAAAPGQESDSELSRTITSAETVLRALDTCNWGMLANLATLAGHQDGIGDRSERLLTDVTEAASASEFTTELAPVLTRANAEAAQIITDAASATQAPAPAPPQAPASAAPASQGPANTHRTRRITPSAAEADIAAILADVQSEIRAYSDQHPGTVIEIDWRPVSQDGPA
ncbi:PglY protein [Haloechinothrix salitolerans]|uniref:PglY protein n=1 Tax=Haloechinothrix salitolerans TaxID=926830 RepID=A0ABW2BSQ4_9PSEU